MKLGKYKQQQATHKWQIDSKTMKVETATSQVQILVQVTVHIFIMLPANKPSMQIMKAIYVSNKGQHEEKPRL
jgi:hypothetical protein